MKFRIKGKSIIIEKNGTYFCLDEEQMSQVEDMIEAYRAKKAEKFPDEQKLYEMLRHDYEKKDEKTVS